MKGIPLTCPECNGQIFKDEDTGLFVCKCNCDHSCVKCGTPISAATADDQGGRCDDCALKE